MGADAAMGAGAEFDLIRSLVARWGPRAQGIGDDAALIDIPAGHQLVASVDSAVDGVHFRRDWLTPGEIGYRATAAALSDLAAMAAMPVAMLVAFAIPDDWISTIPEVADGIGEMAASAGATIAGGNVSRAAVFTITTTVLGVVQRPLRRDGVRSGDRIYVTGRLGGPGDAVRAFAGGSMPDDASRGRFARPAPRIREAQWLAAHGATACIDISDGLLADLAHLAAASGTVLSIDLDRLPLLAGSSPMDAAASGEEYELAISAPVELNVRAFEAEFNLPLTEIGTAGAGTPGVQALLGGKRVAPIAGHDHLSR